MLENPLNSIVVVGGGLAGAKAVEAFRVNGYTGELILVSSEGNLPYDRPPLSKNFLTDEHEPNCEIFDSKFYEDNNIELILSTDCESVDPESSRILLSNSRTLNYDALVLATGASPRKINIEGATLEGVHYLRTIEDARRIKEAALTKGEVVIIGAGWIGCELAASLTSLGVKVSVIETQRLPLVRFLGDELGKLYLVLHQKHGVTFYLNSGVEKISGNKGVASIWLNDGTEISAPVLIVGIGAQPNVDCLRDTSLYNAFGIETDCYLKSNVDNIYCAGDVAKTYNTLLGKAIRLEHWAGALSQGPIAAKNILGNETLNDVVPFFYSDQFDLSIEFRGQNDDYDEFAIRGSLEQNEFIAFWIKENKVVGVLNANIWDFGDLFDRILANPVSVSTRDLTDPTVDLNSYLTPR